MLTLNTAPTFRRTVTFEAAGKAVAVDVDFKWMHRKQLRAFMHRVNMVSSRRLAVRITQPIIRAIGLLPFCGKWSQARTVTYRDDFDFLSEIVQGWEGVDVPWSRESCARLVELYPQAVPAILGEWAKALTDQRLGN